ncbi:reverse transcriptase-like protein [Lactobacillus sp. S2-2]|uniref:ribonuclease HI family protein n=1 Tax=Lactobacillus sp. S2-2 TaxID=2692917 RepID=UPI001F1E9E54|nr:ribonuclease HI family protein [Lactobacillus sp. S2-2]MCF6515063.1 reverse transcriptase-like protein [Lactobacillus sp. S2-2]
MYNIYTDGAFNKLHNKSSIGILIFNENQQYQLKKKIDVFDNHIAEFEACIISLTWPLNLLGSNEANKTNVFLHSDSKILIDSINKSYAKKYQDYVNKINALQSNFNIVLFKWISDKENSGAHNLALQALNEK